MSIASVDRANYELPAWPHVASTDMPEIRIGQDGCRQLDSIRMNLHQRKPPRGIRDFDRFAASSQSTMDCRYRVRPYLRAKVIGALCVHVMWAISGPAIAASRSCETRSRPAWRAA